MGIGVGLGLDVEGGIAEARYISCIESNALIRVQADVPSIGEWTVEIMALQHDMSAGEHAGIGGAEQTVRGISVGQSRQDQSAALTPL
jgi:hypothetical protein